LSADRTSVAVTFRWLARAGRVGSLRRLNRYVGHIDLQSHQQ
jgi:hypothetical protein